MSIPFLLRALQYPPAGATPSPDDPEQLQAVVVWLEHTKVRRYPIEGRATLQSADPATARAALQQYLADLECPLRLQPGNGGERAMLQWLLTHAGEGASGRAAPGGQGGGTTRQAGAV